MSNTQRVLLLGPPGAGKGTQSSNIAEHFDVEHIETGDVLRSNKDLDISHLDGEYDTPRAYMEAGELVPDEVVTEIVEHAIDGTDGFVLDGYPRNTAQARALDSMTDLDVVLHIDVSEDELIHRLTGRRIDPETGELYHVEYNPPPEEIADRVIQRDDDTESTVTERLRVYRESTEPVIEHYEESGQLVRIDGERDPDAVWQEIEQTIQES